jgi:hypothetical protein
MPVPSGEDGPESSAVNPGGGFMNVCLVTYEARFGPEHELWYADISIDALDPRKLQVSEPIVEWIQVMPERTVTASAETHANNVVLSVTAKGPRVGRSRTGWARRQPLGRDHRQPERQDHRGRRPSRLQCWRRRSRGASAMRSSTLTGAASCSNRIRRASKIATAADRSCESRGASSRSSSGPSPHRRLRTRLPLRRIRHAARVSGRSCFMTFETEPEAKP